MDWWTYLKIFWGVSALIVSVIMLILVWKMRGVFTWRRSLKRELAALAKEGETAEGPRKAAIDLVVERCQVIEGAGYLKPGEVTRLPDFVRDIASCYHLESETPELEITAHRLLQSVRESMDRLDMILQRRGFERLKGVRIRHLRSSVDWYQKVSEYRIVQWLKKHWEKLSKAYLLRLVAFPDPFSWLAYLSNRLTMLSLTKYLILDVYMFTGTLAVKAYDQDPEALDDEPDEEQLEGLLQDLDEAEEDLPNLDNEEVQAIRRELVGFSNLVMSTPGIEQWKDAVTEAAQIIAKQHFPDAEQPLDEAALGPLLERTRAWIDTICHSEQYPVVHRVHHLRLSTLLRLRSLPDMLPAPARAFMKKAWKTYSWLKWPWKVYKMVRKASPLGLALSVGSVVAKKGFIGFVYRWTFDSACRELDVVYRQSAAPREKEISTSPTPAVELPTSEEPEEKEKN